MEQTDKAAKIAHVNDTMRRCLFGVLMTQGVEARGQAFVERALTELAAFDDFTPDNDPYGEHDFGAFTVDGVRLFFKIDCFDEDGRYPEDPTAPSVRRAITLMLASEY